MDYGIISVIIQTAVSCQLLLLILSNTYPVGSREHTGFEWVHPQQHHLDEAIWLWCGDVLRWWCCEKVMWWCGDMVMRWCGDSLTRQLLFRSYVSAVSLLEILALDAFRPIRATILATSDALHINFSSVLGQWCSSKKITIETADALICHPHQSAAWWIHSLAKICVTATCEDLSFWSGVGKQLVMWWRGDEVTWWYGDAVIDFHLDFFFWITEFGFLNFLW